MHPGELFTVTNALTVIAIIAWLIAAGGFIGAVIQSLEVRRNRSPKATWPVRAFRPVPWFLFDN